MPILTLKKTPQQILQEELMAILASPVQACLSAYAQFEAKARQTTGDVPSFMAYLTETFGPEVPGAASAIFAAANTFVQTASDESIPSLVQE